jgi:hypothetical protein
MKYAILGPRGGIFRITNKQPAQTPPEGSVVELTEEQAATVEAAFAATPRQMHFYKDGELLTKEQFREQQIANRPKPLITAEKYIERQGFTALRLIALMDLEKKLAENGKTSAKLSAVREWLDNILAVSAMNPEPRNDWPNLPYSFEETSAEAMGTLID